MYQDRFSSTGEKIGGVEVEGQASDRAGMPMNSGATDRVTLRPRLGMDYGGL